MSSRREAVIVALVSLITAAVPTATVRRNASKPQTIPANGFVNIFDGEPGDPEFSLSPSVWVYEHRVLVSVAAPGGSNINTDSVMDGILRPIGAAIVSNRTLGGLCDYVMAMAPTMLSIDASGAVSGKQADIEVVAVYGVSDPLN